MASAKSNHCLDAAKACNLNDNCKKLRSSYISICNREISPAERCNRRKCHKALRQFFDRVPGEYTYRMLFCSCRDRACAERRRQTILPSCSYEDKEKPNCLDLRGVCRTDHLCRYARPQSPLRAPGPRRARADTCRPLARSDPRLRFVCLLCVHSCLALWESTVNNPASIEFHRP